MELPKFITLYDSFAKNPVFFILFGHSETDFVWYLIGIYLPQD